MIGVSARRRPRARARSAGSSSAGSCSASSRSAARAAAEGAQPALAVLGHEVGERAGTAGGERGGRRSRPARWVVERVGQRVERRAAAAAADTRATGARRSPSERSAACRSRTARSAAGAEVGLADHEHVRHLHDPGLQELEHVARARLHHDRHRVGRRRHVRLGLADSHRLDHHDVEGDRERAGGGARGRREAAEALAAGHGADEQAAVGRVGVDPQRGRRAARRPMRREDGSTARIATVRPRARHTRASAPSSVDLPAPGGPVSPTMWPGASPPSAAGAQRGEQRRRRGARRRRAVLHQRCRRSGAALTSPRAQPLAAEAHAAAASPLRAATMPTTSRRMRVSSKSFGV